MHKSTPGGQRTRRSKTYIIPRPATMIKVGKYGAIEHDRPPVNLCYSLSPCGTTKTQQAEGQVSESQAVQVSHQQRN